MGWRGGEARRRKVKTRWLTALGIDIALVARSEITGLLPLVSDKLGSQCALWWGLCDICWRGCVTDGSMVWLCSTYLLPPPAKSHHRLLPPITTTTSTNNNQYVTYQHHFDICHSGGIKLFIFVALLLYAEFIVYCTSNLNISYIVNTFCIKRNSLYTNQNSIPKL